MEQAVLPQKDVANLLKKHFALVVLDIDDNMLPEGFGYFAVPTFYVVDEHGKKLDRAVGGVGAEEFLSYLKRFVKE
jgi:thioredoxin-related protein